MDKAAIKVCPKCKATSDPGKDWTYCACIIKEDVKAEAIEGHPVDWSAPIFAIDLKTKSRQRVSIDKIYHSSDAKPVKFPFNLWTRSGSGGTWYFDDNGLAVGGIGPEGYNAAYIVGN